MCGIFSVFIFVLLLGLLLLLGWLVFCFDFVFVLLLGLLLLLGWLVFCFDFVFVLLLGLLLLLGWLVFFGGLLLLLGWLVFCFDFVFVFVCWLDGWLAFLLLLFCHVISQNSIIQLYCPSGEIHLRCGQCFLVVNNGIGACY